MVEQTSEKIALDERVLMLFEGNLKRIFAMKISRSTFRELQNVILNCANQNKETANFLFETLMTGQIKGALSNERHREILEEAIKHFTIPARLAKEIYERGEFVNIITSDLVTQEDKFAFLNCLRLIKGDEIIFMSDTRNMVDLIQHFVGRLFELEKAPKGKPEIEKFKKELHMISERLRQLAQA